MRNLDEHIGPAELASLPESLEALRQNGQFEGLVLHIDQCPECADLVTLHFRLQELTGSSVPGSFCLSEQELLNYVAGIGPDSMDTVLTHVSECNSCSAKLREIAIWTQPSIPEALTDALQSSRPAWQLRMAERMSREAHPQGGQVGSVWRAKKKFWSPWLVISVTAVFLAALAVGSLRIWRAANPSEESLLAQAYNQQRRIPLRVPGGNPVAMESRTRGVENLRPTSAALLKLKLRAEQHLEKEPNNAYWHQVLGEANLIENEPFEARRNLELAQTSNPSLPNLQSDLAAAWFLVGDSGGSGEAYAEAAELYSRALLDADADSALLYYNRALCWERQNITQNALADLHAALAIERSPAWRNAIETEIARLSQKSSAAGIDPSGQHAKHQDDEDVVAEDGYEEALARATEQLLPRWSSDTSAQSEISAIARSGLLHNDRWLQNWIQAMQGHASLSGDRALAAALVAVSSGDLERSLLESTEAIRDYAKVGNNPGRIRATLAEVYALQRLDRFHECLNIAVDLEHSSELYQYAWIRSQLYLEEGSCHLAAGDFDSAEREISSALAVTSSNQLLDLHLRAIAGQSQVLEFRGSPVEAWQLNADALHLCRRIACPPLRKYLLLYTLVQAAQSLSLPHVALEVMRTAESVAAASKDPTVHAYSTEILAQVAGAAGDFKQSDVSFSAALAFADQVPSMRSVDLYQAEWQTDRAAILLKRGQPSLALDLLRKSQTALLASDYQYGRIRLFSRLAAAQLAMGRVDTARQDALAAVREAEKTLPSLHTTIEREQWERENRDCYNQLVQAYLHQNRFNDAFFAWERSRYLPVSSQLISDVPLRSTAQSRTSDQHPAALVLAAVGDSYFGWLVSTSPLHVLHSAALGDRTTVHQLVTTFYHLCSDPDSNLQDVRAVGEHLYSTLLLPFAGDLTSDQPIWLDLDPSLASVAFPALWVPGKGWLGESHALTVLPYWWLVRPRVAWDPAGLATQRPTIIVNGFAPHESAYSEAADIAAMLPHPTLLDGNHATVSGVLSDLQSARMFHFSGHAQSESGSTRLLLPASDAAHSYLDAADVSSLRLHKCQIAVLAACNTNASNPDRVEYAPDLRNALLQSGVHAVVSSHWDVDDRATAALMKIFYRGLLVFRSPSDSLRNAEHVVKTDAKWQHPYYWASFQLFAN